MENPLATVTVMTENGPVIINATDYNAEIHTLADGEEKPIDTGSDVQIAYAENGEPARIINEAGNAVDVNGTTMKTLDPAAQTGGAGVVTPEMDGNTIGQMKAAADGTQNADGTATPPPAVPPARFVTKTGAKYYVVDAVGEKVTDVEGIDAKGYKNEGEAWAAVTALAG